MFFAIGTKISNSITGKSTGNSPYLLAKISASLTNVNTSNFKVFFFLSISFLM